MIQSQTRRFLKMLRVIRQDLECKMLKYVPSESSCMHSKVTSNWKGLVKLVGLSNTSTLMMSTKAILFVCVFCLSIRKSPCRFVSS